MFSLDGHDDSEARFTHDTFEGLASLTVKVNTTCLTDPDYLRDNLITRNKRKFATNLCDQALSLLVNFI